MPSVKIRVQSVDDSELNSQQPMSEVSGTLATTEKLAVVSIFAHQALNLGKQLVSTSINNIGNFTGDYIKQDQVQYAVGIVSDLATIGIGFAAGPVAGAVATIGVAFKNVMNVVTENRNDLHAERRVDLLRQRSGNTLTNGSRTNGE